MNLISLYLFLFFILIQIQSQNDTTQNNTNIINNNSSINSTSEEKPKKKKKKRRKPRVEQPKFEPETSGVHINDTVFDEKLKNIIKEKNLNPNKKITKEQLKSIFVLIYKKEEKPGERRKYDEDGHILYKQGTNQTSKDSVDYTYDDNGLLKQEVQYGWNDGSYIFSWRHYYYYDNRNFMIKEHVDQYYKSYGKFFGYYEQEYEYDETGNMICRHYKGLKDGNIVNNGTKFCNEYDKDGNTIKIFSKIYDGDTWRDNSLSEDTEFTYNHGLCKYVCNVNTDITWPDSILISYRDKDEIASSVIQNSTASIRYTLHGNYIRFNITAEDFKYMSVSNLAGQCVYYTRPSAKLSKGINIICIKTNKGKYTYKLLL